MSIDLSLDLGAELLELLLLGHREIRLGAVILGCLPPAAPAREAALHVVAQRCGQPAVIR